MSKYLTNQAIISQSKIEGTIASMEQSSQISCFDVDCHRYNEVNLLPMLWWHPWVTFVETSNGY